MPVYTPSTANPLTTFIRAGEGNYGGNLATAHSVLTLTTAPTLNQFFAMIPLPRTARVIDVIWSFTDMDSNASPTLSAAIGDATTAGRYIAAQAIGTAAGLVRMNVQAGHGFVNTADTFVGITFTAVAATFAAGTVMLTVNYIQE